MCILSCAWHVGTACAQVDFDAQTAEKEAALADELGTKRSEVELQRALAKGLLEAAEQLEAAKAS